MTLRAVRSAVAAVCVVGIAGMIASSVAGSTGAAITFGLVTVVAILCSMVATAVTGGPRRGDAPPARGEGEGGALGNEIEALVRALVEDGADEDRVRRLVRDAVRFGRSAR